MADDPFDSDAVVRAELEFVVPDDDSIAVAVAVADADADVETGEDVTSPGTTPAGSVPSRAHSSAATTPTTTVTAAATPRILAIEPGRPDSSREACAGRAFVFFRRDRGMGGFRKRRQELSNPRVDPPRDSTGLWSVMERPSLRPSSKDSWTDTDLGLVF